MKSVRVLRPKPASELGGGAAALAATLILIVAILGVRVPYFALTPGPAQDVGRLIQIDGAKTTPVNGQLLLTTVSLHEIRVVEAVRGWFDPSIAVLSRSAIIPADSSEEEVEQRTNAQMEESHVLAGAAALDLLGYDVEIEPSGVRISAIDEDVPASEILRRGDVVVGVDGQPITQDEQLRAAVRRHRVGDVIGLRVLRGADTVDVSTTTVGLPEDPSIPAIGVHVETVPRVRLPLAIDIDSLGIGGPSAGLIFAVGIYDLLDAADLTRGRVIAGTGEISIEGDVGPVGGIRQKVESARRQGAHLFVVPLAELDQACSVAKEMAVVGVEDLKQTIDVLRGSAGAAVRTCH
ncbi:MAG: YlbL family protein [Actinomycetota bacterium]